MTEATSASPARPSSLMDDILEIFVAPSKVFARCRNDGYGRFLLVQMVLMAVVVVATIGLARPYWDAQIMLGFQQAAERGQAMPEGAAESARKFGVYTGLAAQVLLIPVLVWIGALFVLLGGKVAAAPVSYRQGALIFTLAGFPRLLSPLTLAVQGLLVDPTSIRSMSDASLGPARFLDPSTASPVLLGVLANLDLINIWAFVLVGIGIKVIGRGSTASAWIGAGVVFACTLAITIIPAALF